MSNSEFSDSYQKALKLLEKGDFAAAETEFLAIRDKGFSASQLEANLGFLYFKTSKHEKSILHYQNALLLEPNNHEVREQLTLVQKNILQGLGNEMSDPSEWAYQLSLRMSAAQGLSFSLLCVTLFLVFRKKSFGKFNKLQGYFAAIAILSFALGIFALKGKEIQTIETAAPLHSAAVLASPVTFEIPPGARVRLIRISGDLAEVERPKAFRGWIEKKHLHAALEPYLATAQ